MFFKKADTIVVGIQSVPDQYGKIGSAKINHINHVVVQHLVEVRLQNVA